MRRTTEVLDTSTWRITRTHASAFFTAFAGVLLAVALLGGSLVLMVADDGFWHSPEGERYSLGNVLLFVAMLTGMPLAMTGPVWLFGVWRWKSILDDCHEVDGRIIELRQPKPDMWVFRFRFGDHKGRVVVRPTPWVRRLEKKRRIKLLVSNRNPRRALPRDFFLAS